MIEAFRLLQGAERRFANDAGVLAAMGSLLFIAEDTAGAEQYYRRAEAAKPEFAPYAVNLAAALLKEGKAAEAKQQLEHALQLDPYLEMGIQLLNRVYHETGEDEKAHAVEARYREAMGYTH